MTQQTLHTPEGHFVNRSLFFNGEYYSYWKDMMRYSLSPQALICGKSLSLGYYVPMEDQQVQGPQQVGQPP